MRRTKATKKARAKPMKDHLVVRIPDTLRVALEKAAAADRRKLSDYVRILLEDHLAGKRKRR